MPVVSVPVLASGQFLKIEDVLSYIGKSHFISSDHKQNLIAVSEKLGLDPERQLKETEDSDYMEGIYIKIEENGQVVSRLKFVRNSFAQCVNESNTHWLERPIVPNQLAVPLEELF